MNDARAHIAARVHYQDRLLQVDRPAARQLVHVAPGSEGVIQHGQEIAKTHRRRLAVLGRKARGLSGQVILPRHWQSVEEL